NTYADSIIADTSGTYTVTIIDSIGCQSSVSYAYTTTTFTGTSSASLANTLTVYPNPANSELIIILSNGTDNFSYTLINLEGEELLAGQGNSKISVASLPEGFYVLKVQIASGNIAYKKLIIER
ncbi:MAG TPA: T9SS type A sorting domain-containing protein, partial [Bacteroidia bacterium]|nr:T9SS type A sorting domain-containing protein [Bacteroidia bacterium]